MRDTVRPRPTAASVGALFICSLLASGVGHAGGSTVPVSVTRLDLQGDDFTLVVRPGQSDPPDPFMGRCERFEVRGSYRSLRGAGLRQEAGLSREAHRRALQFLRQAFVSGQVVDFGAIGTGFVPVDADKPCVVKSRALQLLEDDRGAHVLSYHDSTSARSD